MNHIDYLYKLHNPIQQAKNRAIENDNHTKQLYYEYSEQALLWAINRLDPKIPYRKRIPANQKHYRNIKPYSITMTPEDHDRLVALGKELHIEGGFSGVLTYIAQNCTLIHEKTDTKS